MNDPLYKLFEVTIEKIAQFRSLALEGPRKNLRVGAD